MKLLKAGFHVIARIAGEWFLYNRCDRRMESGLNCPSIRRLPMQCSVMDGNAKEERTETEGVPQETKPVETFKQNFGDLCFLKDRAFVTPRYTAITLRIN